jgi:hypothetical protein
MSNDFKGDLKEFAIVIPVPTFIEKEQIHVGETALLDHLDAYSAPRLVEYFDTDPCAVEFTRSRKMASRMAAPSASADVAERAKSLGVTIEAQYTVGEYDILILSAKQSDGLETWLRESGYKVPSGASAVLASYIRQGMKFFVAKVNLTEQAKLGFTFLRPIQVAYESPKFMLPIRLGMVNADGEQELFVFTLTQKGRVETTNYRTSKLPTGMDVPLYVKDEFSDFYKSLFTQQVKKEEGRAVFVEYAWDMNWCDPCAAQPLSGDELRQLGAFWVAPQGAPGVPGGPAMPRMRGGFPMRQSGTFLTRLHLRYDGAHFPEDLVFQETADRQNFQGRYVLRHPWSGSPDACPAAKSYFDQLRQRQENEAQALASLTGWDIAQIRNKMHLNETTAPREKDKWWNGIWK